MGRSDYSVWMTNLGFRGFAVGKNKDAKFSASAGNS
jgi:hypothetical protein